MKSITTQLAVFAVVLTIALSMMAAPAVAAPADKVTVTDSENMDDQAKKGVMPGDNVNFPETVFDGEMNENFPETVFDGGDEEELQDGSDPVLVSP